ncbi:Uncharacterised protein [Chromobacterium violaceum]|uniref:Uncharacterized protein n=1 Tax=Chromobacterium violaceum TaxID=536 RepID=A0A3S4LL56_CHRVL|nr:Uncharacterised protein [Chromobacterium violaceum]
MAAARRPRARHDGDGPRKIFAKREDGARDNRDHRDDKPQWQPREDRAPRQDGDAPRKLFAKREDGERDSRFRRDDKPQWQPREDRARGATGTSIARAACSRSATPTGSTSRAAPSSSARTTAATRRRPARKT